MKTYILQDFPTKTALLPNKVWKMNLSTLLHFLFPHPEAQAQLQQLRHDQTSILEYKTGRAVRFKQGLTKRYSRGLDVVRWTYHLKKKLQLSQKKFRHLL